MNNNFYDDFPEADTSILACDYIRWRLAQIGYDWEDCPELPRPNKIRLILRVMAEDFEALHKKELAILIKQINITPQNSFPSFMGVCESMFEDGQISWGRIVAVFSFGGILAVYCVQNYLPQLVGNIADWIAVLCDARFYNFIASNEGWVKVFIPSFISFN